MAARLGWDDARIAREIAAYEAEVRRTLVSVDDVMAGALTAAPPRR
jgi:hypothetical protein